MQIQKKNAEFEKKDEATPSEKKLAAEFGMTIEEYRHQHKNYVDTAKREMEHRRMPPDLKIGDENEENCSSSEQDNERRYEPQLPNLPAITEGMRMPHQSKLSPRDQHYMKGGEEGASLPSHFNDGSHEHPLNHSPHSSRRPPSPHSPPCDPPPPSDPVPFPPTDPHHQFTIGSMVCLDVRKGEPLYGVLQWVGTVPDFNAVIAGVELVSD